MRRWGVLLDTDGVINEEAGYLSNPQALSLLPGAAQAIRRLNQAHVPVIVITNQAGVARGYFPEERVHEIHQALSRLLAAEGAHIDRYYYCHHHPTKGIGPYLPDCECRKPKPGMLFEAAEEFGLDLKRCYLIGDKALDIETGWRAGTRTILVLTGYGEEMWRNWSSPFKPDHVARNLEEAVEWILSGGNPELGSKGVEERGRWGDKGMGRGGDRVLRSKGAGEPGSRRAWEQGSGGDFSSAPLHPSTSAQRKKEDAGGGNYSGKVGSASGD